MWHLRKVPKVLYMYWGKNRPLSYMQYLTAASFSKYNPDWEIQIYSPIITCTDKTWDTDEHKHDVEWNEDYFESLKEIKNVKLLEFDFEDIGIDNNISEVHKSDILRLYLLCLNGGVWSDFDIFYTKSIHELSINFSVNR